MANSDHTRIGADFQKQVLEWFADHIGPGFELEVKKPIGNPPKDHKFDIVNPEKRIAIECKRFTWTESGNVPSAKIRTLNEAAFFLSFLPDDYDKYIVMLRDFNAKRGETLAEYYFRAYHHLLGRIVIAEYNLESGNMNVVNPNV